MLRAEGGAQLQIALQQSSNAAHTPRGNIQTLCNVRKRFYNRPWARTNQQTEQWERKQIRPPVTICVRGGRLGRTPNRILTEQTKYQQLVVIFKSNQQPVHTQTMH